MRGFKVCKGFEDQEVNLPVRGTANSAGYDFECAQDTVVPSLFETGGECKPVLIPTGIKAYMGGDEALFLYNRSSNPKKYGLVLANSVGVVDSDYFENPDNDGHIMFAVYNVSAKAVTFKKGERVGQGVFQAYLKADGDGAAQKRMGGFGSTD